MMIEITDVLNELSKQRPVFHSEADFKHALAWKIQERCSGFNIRLEKRVVLNEKEAHLDILVFRKKKMVAVEAKYRTKNLDVVIDSEKYSLKKQGSEDQARYDFVKDISRLEKFLEKPYDSSGLAIFLTNDQLYWRGPTRSANTVDKAFRIHEGKRIKGALRWNGASEGTMKGRQEPVKLRREYTLNWKDYSNLEKQNSKFRYLLVEIKRHSNV